MRHNQLAAALAFLGFLAGTAPAGSDPVYLIAHRGGIVEDRYAENSPGSVQAAIERGYWMIEVDIRETKDGRLVVQHDPTFQRFYNDPRSVSEMSWEEISKLRATPGGTRPMEFHELAAACRGKIRLMLDVKGETHPRQFYESLEKSLRANQLLSTAYVLGSAQPKEYFRGKAFLSADRKVLRAAAERGEDVARLYFLFELGSILDESAIQMARKLGVTPVAGINTFRYEMAREDHWAGAERDIRKLLKLGIRHFQIDSIYDKWLLKQPGR
jgi:glycerophosphoryl diester phosphodiesterase